MWPTFRKQAILKCIRIFQCLKWNRDFLCFFVRKITVFYTISLTVYIYFLLLSTKSRLLAIFSLILLKSSYHLSFHVICKLIVNLLWPMQFHSLQDPELTNIHSNSTQFSKDYDLGHQSCTRRLLFSHALSNLFAIHRTISQRREEDQKNQLKL